MVSRRWVVVGGVVVIALVAVVLAARVRVMTAPIALAELGGHEFRLEVADTPQAQARGLAGRSSIPEDGGMLFVFSRSGRHTFWMKGMLMPIDILWVRGETIVFMAERVNPPPAGTRGEDLERLRPTEPADRVIEIRAGRAAELGLSIGQRVRILIP